MRNNFTPEEIKEVEEFTRKMSVEEIARYYNISPYDFNKFRSAQPELEEAFQRGLKGRKNSSFGRKKRKIFDESMPKLKHTLTLSQDEAWAKFKKEFDEKKKKRSIKELSYDRYEF